MIAGAGLTARVHLSLSCKGLANVDVGSKSDPFVVSVCADAKNPGKKYLASALTAAVSFLCFFSIYADDTG